MGMEFKNTVDHYFQLLLTFHRFLNGLNSDDTYIVNRSKGFMHMPLSIRA